MNSNIIYLKGNPGFKPAVIIQLGKHWIKTAYDHSHEIVSFSLPDSMRLEGFKEAIGKNLIAEFNIVFSIDRPRI